MKSVNGGTSGSYGFDGNGKRVKKTEGGASTYYVYSSVIGSAVMGVASAGVQRAYVMNGGSVVAQRNPDGNFYWLHQDHLGSGRKMTNTSGNLTYRAEFDPYGKLLYEWSATPNQNTKKFTGYERDAGSGLDYAQARMYGSEWGRFMSPDPIGLEGASKNSPLSYNRYSYVNGNPVNHIDPSGNLLANPDESGGSACTGFFWGSFTNDDYGNSTIRVWGGFWSCQVSGGGGEGIQPEKKQKKKPSSINLSYAYQSIDEKSIANFAINKAGRKSANLEILAAFCKKDTVFDIAINFSTTNVNLVFDPYIPIQGRSIRPNKSTLILVNDNISIEDITVKILNDKGLDRDGNELASYQWLLRIKILNETADKILSSVNINARGQETLYLGRAVPLVFDEATLNISCNAE